ncbi:MAG: two-component regulator propeller domain-containing protein [Imperialibacter sp.]|uniref:ligand-binding sensor domain-containing protein n=1 Tax=Imperialibacter sp. TaxID=2038411 RepID=UPI0032EF53BA
MKKYTLVYLLLLAAVFCASCKQQTKADQPTETPQVAEVKTVAAYTGPTNITRAVIQDQKGDIWMATWEGVFRYDARLPDGQGTFTNMTTGISDARFFSALEDTKGHLWFGTIGSGVYRYDGVNFTNFTTKDGLPNNEITWIYEDKAGHIWFGVNGGASRYDGTSFRNFLIEGETMVEDTTGKTIPDLTRPPMEVNAIMEDRSGKLWFATRGRTFMYDGKTFTALLHDDQPFTNVRTVIEDSKGQLWFGGNDGMWRYSTRLPDGQGNKLTQISKDFCGYIYEDSRGNIWTSSETGKGWALSRYDAMTLAGLKATPTVIDPWKGGNPGLVFGILEANDGNIWFGSTDGVYRYDGANLTDFKGKEGQK